METDEKLTLSNICRGDMEKFFQRAMQQLTDYCLENNQDLGAIEGALTFTVKVKARRDEPEDRKTQGDILDFTATVDFPKITFPKRLGSSQRVRLDGTTLVVDGEEMDEHGTRALPFKRNNGQE